jgi:hypothetical protein
MRPSFLEHPRSADGGILAAIEWLQSSALDWGPVNHRDEGYTWEMDHLRRVTESALTYFDEFRTVFLSPPLCLLEAEGVEVSQYDGYGRIPARIHKDVFGSVWRLHTTSLYDLASPPGIAGLKAVGISLSAPLRDRHLAVTAALACCSRCINELCGILGYWRDMFKQWLPRGRTLHFDGNYGDPEWDDLLLKLREDPANLLWETERRRDAFAWIERAEAWLAHADQIEIMSERIERIERSARAVKQSVLDGARKKRSEAAKKGLPSRRRAMELQEARIKAAWLALQPSQREYGGVGIVARRLGLTSKTVSGYLKKLGYRKK